MFDKYLFRKLFEPDLYPGAPVLPVFEKYFGQFQTRNYSQVKWKRSFHLNVKKNLANIPKKLLLFLDVGRSL